ncbi:copper chaperone PCu(A)C [Mycolicibacterium sp.]|uniref:copper chaperone PCu(A)C n=1 Tax=Mycolicibacterium sp. TaxID=2320850 RepID=UPI003D097EDC
MSRRLVPVLVLAVALTSACTAPEPEHDHQPAVTFEEPWASTGHMGMAAVFGTFVNDGHHDAHIVSGTSPVAGRVELHEVVPDASGTKTMQPKAGGITVPADGSHQLVPGGDHLMLMDLKETLQPGTDVSVTVTFDDGSTLPITAQVRDFAGGNEEYRPGGHDHG